MADGTRSNLWGAMRTAIETIQPRYVVAENVRGLLSATAASDSDLEPGNGSLGDGPANNLRALGRVLGDLADLGYDAQWHSLRAADVGAAHGRFRVFILAERRDTSTHALRCGSGGRGTLTSPGESRKSDLTPIWADDRPGEPDATTPDTGRLRGISGRFTGTGETESGRSHGEPVGRGRARIDWGPYEPAIRRAEQVMGRRAPAPTELTKNGRHRLSARFAEWLMMLDEGHVTGVPGISRADQLKMLGNGVVPTQAMTALQVMLARATEAQRAIGVSL